MCLKAAPWATNTHDQGRCPGKKGESDRTRGDHRELQRWHSPPAHICHLQGHADELWSSVMNVCHSNPPQGTKRPAYSVTVAITPDSRDHPWHLPPPLTSLVLWACSARSHFFLLLVRSSCRSTSNAFYHEEEKGSCVSPDEAGPTVAKNSSLTVQAPRSQPHKGKSKRRLAKFHATNCLRKLLHGNQWYEVYTSHKFREEMCQLSCNLVNIWGRELEEGQCPCWQTLAHNSVRTRVAALLWLGFPQSKSSMALTMDRPGTQKRVYNNPKREIRPPSWLFSILERSKFQSQFLTFASNSKYWFLNPVCHAPFPSPQLWSPLINQIKEGYGTLISLLYSSHPCLVLFSFKALITTGRII